MPDVTLDFTFSIFDDLCRGRMNPGVCPAGYVFIPATLFGAAESEAEFAGMLAHSMAHVAARHSMRQAGQGAIAGVGTLPLIFIGGIAGGVLGESRLAAWSSAGAAA